MTKNCNLCKNEVANNPNSHIIPKFMSKRLFEFTKPHHTIQLNRNGKKIKLQDTPKENNILCYKCEKRFSFLETYFSRVLIEINSLQNFKRNYSVINQHQNEIIVCEDLHPDLFKLFIYSIIWRCSISSLIHFETFKLPSHIEEEIRCFLDDNLKSSHKELMINLGHIKKIPQYHTCLIKPKNKTRGIFTAYNFGKDAFAIYTVDYALFFYTSEIPFIQRHQLFSNRDNEKVRIVNGNDEEWKILNNLVVSNMLKK